MRPTVQARVAAAPVNLSRSRSAAPAAEGASPFPEALERVKKKDSSRANDAPPVKRESKPAESAADNRAAGTSRSSEADETTEAGEDPGDAAAEPVDEANQADLSESDEIAPDDGLAAEEEEAGDAKVSDEADEDGSQLAAGVSPLGAAVEHDPQQVETAEGDAMPTADAPEGAASLNAAVPHEMIPSEHLERAAPTTPLPANAAAVANPAAVPADGNAEAGQVEAAKAGATAIPSELAMGTPEALAADQEILASTAPAESARASAGPMVQSLETALNAMAENAAPRPDQPIAAAGPAVRGEPALPPEARFSQANHENIVSSMRSELLPNGGTMRIRLDPPHLGALQVTVQMRDGVLTASFQTSGDEATRLLSHSLSQLKTVLESQGVNVEKLQVQQSPRNQEAGNDERQQQQRNPHQQQEQADQQEQQRRAMLRRLWRRLAGDPFDVTG